MPQKNVTAHSKVLDGTLVPSLCKDQSYTKLLTNCKLWLPSLEPRTTESMLNPEMLTLVQTRQLMLCTTMKIRWKNTLLIWRNTMNKPMQKQSSLKRASLIVLIRPSMKTDNPNSTVMHQVDLQCAMVKKSMIRMWNVKMDLRQSLWVNLIFKSVSVEVKNQLFVKMIILNQYVKTVRNHLSQFLCMWKSLTMYDLYKNAHNKLKPQPG